MKKNLIKGLLFCLIILMVVGCTNEKATKKNIESSKSTVIEADTRIFTDSVGRKVTIPNKITKIAPSGSLSQLVLFTSAPDLLVGVSSSFSKELTEHIDKKYQDLPKFGQFYGKSANLNMEALSAAEPEVIIDIGEVKETIKEDMNALQEQVDIPTIFVEANLENMSETYTKLGELLGNRKKMAPLSEYCQAVINQAEAVRSSLNTPEKKSVYYASGNVGLNTNADGSFQAQVFDVVGATNVVTGVETSSQGGGTIISMEQLIQWQPEIILADSKELYQLITTDESWKELEAVNNGKVYKIPTMPYNVLGSPPSVNRIMGIQWLGELLYPDEYQLDMRETIKDFYELFYHFTPTNDEIKDILSYST